MNASIGQPAILQRPLPLSRYVRILLIFLALYAACVSTVSWVGNAKVVFNETRAAPTLAVFHGVQIYQTGLKDVSFCVLYGPLSYLFYLPAALSPEPKLFFLTGGLISFLFYCAPLFLLLWQLGAHRGGHFWTGLLLATLFLLVTINSTSLTMSALSISPDAVALGLAGGACTVLFFYSDHRPWLHPSLIAACTCCAVFSKQNMVALIPILILFGLLIGGRRLAWRLMVCIAAGILLCLAVVVAVYHDLSAVYFNTVVVVRQQPLRWDRAPIAIRFLYEQAPFLLFAIGCLVLIAFAGAGSSGQYPGRRDLFRGLLFACMAVALVPSSIGGMVFWGGWLNALSPALYFTLLTLIAFSYLLCVERPPNSNVPQSAFGVLVILAVVLSPFIAEHVDRSSLRSASSSDMVYRYAVQHPGQVFFPFHQVSVFFAERKFYHSDWGIMNLIAGNFPVSRDDVWRHIPPTARFVAYPPGAPTKWLKPYLAPSQRRVELPGLAGFSVFDLEP